jgi:hypothetical protein
VKTRYPVGKDSRGNRGLPTTSCATSVRACQPQDPPPATFGVGRLATVPMHDPLAKPELGVLGIDLEMRIRRTGLRNILRSGTRIDDWLTLFDPIA